MSRRSASILRRPFDFVGAAGSALSDRGIRAFLLSAVVAVAALHSSEAAADESAAAWLFDQGRTLMLEERFDEACPMLVESQKLEPHVGTLLNVAACHERQHKIGSAWVEYRAARDAARAEGQSDRVSLAEVRIAALEPRVPWLRVFAPASGVDVMLDGAVLPPASLGKEVPVDPGLHLVQGVKADFTHFDERVELREGEHRSIIVRFVETTDAPAESRAERVVLRDRRQEAGRAEARGRLGLEAGAFGGYMFGGIDGGAGMHGTTAGPSLRVGYAATNTIDFGARFLFGPELGDASALAVGPSVVVHLMDCFSVGVLALFGNATLRDDVVVAKPDGAIPVPPRRSLGGGPGVGLELAVRLARFGRHSLLANTTPLLVAGEGKAVLLPIGLAYRFQ